MSQQLYSVEQVADLLGLHVRTVRGYVRDGRLAAVRIGKQYRIAREDLESFTGRPVPGPEVAAAPGGEVTCVVRLEGIDQDRMQRLTTLLTASLTGRPPGGEPLRVETVHDEERSTARLVVIGGLEDSAEILRLIAVLTGQPR
ncbi:helix-turn-helix domain-containing protein [Kitasatospora sp. NPDC094015]|uniref:helix-turn-helix domain-containing protein n=1 Tax=Kitasatospora sp. NPDC094015 TaxID=3155205 RepID=UPI00332A1F74